MDPAFVREENMTYGFFVMGESIGGVETTFVQLGLELAERSGDLILLSPHENSFVQSEFERMNLNFNFYLLPASTGSYLSDDEIAKLKRLGRQISSEFTEIAIVVPSFQSLMLAIWMFNEVENVRLMVGFFHAEAWPLNLGELRQVFRNWSIIKKKNTRLATYQRELLIRLDKHSSCWFMNNEVMTYHQYYYDIEFRNPHIIHLPINFGKFEKGIVASAHRDLLKFVWVGRFGRSKNLAIGEVFRALTRLSNALSERPVYFDLVGYGERRYQKEVTEFASKYTGVRTSFLGRKHPDELKVLLQNNHYTIGFAMGLSALEIAAAGVPTIVVDASDKKHRKSIKGAWLHEAPVGYVGEGLYTEIAGHETPFRRQLFDLIKEILDEPDVIDSYGANAKKFVEENYVKQIQINMVLDAVEQSVFSPYGKQAFRHSKLKIIMRKALRRLFGI